MTWVPRQSRVPSWTWSETVTAGQTSDPVKVSTQRPITVTAKPGGGGTAEVEYTTSPDADIDGATADWQSWDAGAVGVITTDRMLAPITALRFKAVTADADFEIVI